MMARVFLFLLATVALLSGDFLMPDEAFSPKAKLTQAMSIEASIEIAKDIYLYEDQLKLELKDVKGVQILNIQKPKSVEYHDTQVYLKSPLFSITLSKDAGVTGTKTVEFVLSYQGCSTEGLCYEPLSQSYKFDIDTSKIPQSSNTLQSSKQVQSSKEIVKEPTIELSETDAIADTMKSGNIFIILLTFLAFGLALSLTPCVFPMIPIISGVIISQGEGITTKKALLLSVVYVLAMAVAYTIAGVLAGLFGSNLQAALQAPWVIYSFSAVFVALAFSMFGFYELKLPDSLVAKVSGKGERGGLVGVAIMGFLSALIVGPCVAAPLAGALVYIGQTGDAVLGGMALFSMSIGMGLPLIAIGVSAGKFMPKPGAWMTMVSAIFGIVMLGVAIWMLERIVAPYVTMLLFAMLFLGSSLYLGVGQKDAHIFKKSVSYIIFIYSIALFIGVFGGSTSMSKPLEFLKPQTITSSIMKESNHPTFSVIGSIDELDKLLKNSKGKKVLLDFSAEWCTACKELEEVTFGDAKVAKKMGEFVLIQADVTQNNDAQKALSSKYGVFGPPALLFFDEKGELQNSKTIIGFIKPVKFLKHLNAL